MSAIRTLYVSGSIGLGHVTRDLAVARELRALEPRIEVHWLAGPPASDVLADHREILVPECASYRCETDQAEAAARGGRLSLTKYVYRALGGWLHNAKVLGKAAKRGQFDAIIGNETYEVVVAYVFGMKVLPAGVPFTMMFDFYGMDVTTNSLLERLGAWGLNLIWAQERRVTGRQNNSAIFFGEPEDVPDRPFGVFLPNRRRYAQKHVEFVGYPLGFDLELLRDRPGLRAALGYGPEPLVICTVGGTAVGRCLLELCGRAYPLIASRLPGLRMVLVCGPRIDPATLDVPQGVERHGMVPDLYKHLSVCDLAIVQGGGSVTLELTALRRPFLFFPIAGHAEQEITVASRLARHGAGVRMTQAEMTPSSLADAIVANIKHELTYAQVPVDGTRRAAKIILERVSKISPRLGLPISSNSNCQVPQHRLPLG
jgi:UDP-N-acetylglucosamine:LPS N-acetylglucosamine transferase